MWDLLWTPSISWLSYCYLIRLIINRLIFPPVIFLVYRSLWVLIISICELVINTYIIILSIKTILKFLVKLLIDVIILVVGINLIWEHHISCIVTVSCNWRQTFLVWISNLNIWMIRVISMAVVHLTTHSWSLSIHKSIRSLSRTIIIWLVG